MMPARLEHAAAVTGLGAVSGWGWGVEPLWQRLCRGESAIGEARGFDTTGHRTHLASEVTALPPQELQAYPIWKRLSRTDQFAIAAAREAWKHSGLANAEEEGVVGVFFGGSTAAMAEGEVFFSRLKGLAPGPPRASLVATHPLDGPGNEVARFLGTSGPVECQSSACASGALALGAALDALREGRVDVAIAGGADSLCQLTYAGFNSLRAVDEAQCSPFRQGRGGLNLGEGAGFLVLERIGRAAARGRQPLAWLLGAGASCDAHHMTAPHPRGEGAARAIEAALADAEVSTGAISFVNAHGTGTALNDSAEWSALSSVFGPQAEDLPVTSTKGALGHFLGSSGAIEAVVTVLSLKHGSVPPTPGHGPIDEKLGVDLVVDTPRRIEGHAAVSTSFAFGGSNAALVFGRPGGGSAQ